MKIRCIPLAAALFAVTTPMLALAQKTSTDTKISDVRVVNDSIRTTVINQVPVAIQNPVLSVTTEAGDALAVQDVVLSSQVGHITVSISANVLFQFGGFSGVQGKRLLIETVSGEMKGFASEFAPLITIAKGKNGTIERTNVGFLPFHIRTSADSWVAPPTSMQMDFLMDDRPVFLFKQRSQGETVLTFTYRILDIE